MQLNKSNLNIILYIYICNIYTMLFEIIGLIVLNTNKNSISTSTFIWIILFLIKPITMTHIRTYGSKCYQFTNIASGIKASEIDKERGFIRICNFVDLPYLLQHIYLDMTHQSITLPYVLVIFPLLKRSMNKLSFRQFSYDSRKMTQKFSPDLKVL